MFYTDEDVQPAVDVACELFGPNGNMMEGKNVLKNIHIGTFEYGKIWYGDVEGDTDYILNMCVVLSKRIGVTALIVDESF